PQVSDRCTQPLAGGAEQGTPARSLRSCGLHAPSPTGATCLSEQAPPLPLALPGQRRNALGSRRGSSPPRRPHRLPQRPPHLGTKLAAPSPCPLCDSRRRPVGGSHALDSASLSLLLAHQGPQPCVSRQVCGWPSARVPTRQTRILRGPRSPSGSEAIPCSAPLLVSSGLDRLRQAALRRTRIRPALPGPLHPSCRHLQSSLGRLPKRPSHVPLERLCPREQEAEDDPHC